MAVDKPLVQRRLKILEEHIHTIEYMSFTVAEILESKDIQDLICFRLQQAVETATDIASHFAKQIYEFLEKNK